MRENVQFDDDADDARFVSIRSSAAVVLHNVAVEQLLLAEIPNFGEAVGRAGQALLAAQNSLGPHNPWRQQVENTHHVIIQLCKKGKNIDPRRPLKVQVKTLKHDTTKRARRPAGPGAVDRSVAILEGSGSLNGSASATATLTMDDSDDSELGDGNGRRSTKSHVRGPKNRLGSLSKPLSNAPPQPNRPRARQAEASAGPPISRSFDSARSGTPDSDLSGGGGLSREERVRRELDRIQVRHPPTHTPEKPNNNSLTSKCACRWVAWRTQRSKA